MELRKEEEKYLKDWQNANLPIQAIGEYVNILYRRAREANSIDIAYVNWLKIAIADNNKDFVDACFKQIGVTEQQLEDGIQYAISHKDTTDINLMDTIAKNLVSNKYQLKHAIEHPNAEDKEDYKDLPYKKLNHLDYLVERIRDVLKQKEDTKNMVLELRERVYQTKDTLKPQ